MTFLSCMFVVILVTFCIDFVQINMYVCMYRLISKILVVGMTT